MLEPGGDEQDATPIDARPLRVPALERLMAERDAARATHEAAPGRRRDAPAKQEAPPPAQQDAPPAGTSDNDAAAAAGDRTRGASRRFWLVAALAVAAVAVAVTFAVRLGRNGAATGPLDPSSSPTSAPTGPPLRFVVAPTVESSVIRAELAPFLGWLGAALDRRVELVIAESYDQTGEIVAQDKADFGLLLPLLFIRALAKEPRLQPLALRLFDGLRASDGYLLVRDDGPLSAAADLRGHSICYVDKASTTGYLLPASGCARPASPRTRTSWPVRSGDHVAAMRDLAAGKCDAAAVYSGAYLTARQQGIAVGRLRVPRDHRPRSAYVLAAAPGMPEGEMKALRAALLRFDRSGTSTRGASATSSASPGSRSSAGRSSTPSARPRRARASSKGTAAPRE